MEGNEEALLICFSICCNTLRNSWPRMKKEAEFIKNRLSAEAKVVIAHVSLSPFECLSSSTESNALR